MLAALPSTSAVISSSRSALDEEFLDSDDDNESVELDEFVSWRQCYESEENEVPENVDEKPKVHAHLNLKIKNELRNKIQERRVSQGAGELKVTFEPPKQYPLSPAEQERSDIRRQRNRDSANRSRLKRKFKEEHLEKEMAKLTKEHEELQTQVNALSKVKKTMSVAIMSHKCTFKPTPSAGESSQHAQSYCSHAHSSGVPRVRFSHQSNDFYRGRNAFKSLSEERQIALLKAYLKRTGDFQGTSANC